MTQASGSDDIFDNPPNLTPQGERFWNYLSLEGEYTGSDTEAHFLREKPPESPSPDWKLQEVRIFTPAELEARDREIAEEAWERARAKMGRPAMYACEYFDDYWKQREEARKRNE